MERNTIELTAHTTTIVDENTATIKLAGPVCTSDVACTGVHGDVSAHEKKCLLKHSFE